MLSRKTYTAALLVFAVSGLEQSIVSPGQNSGNYFAPIPLEDHSEHKVDILEMLQKAKVDLKPLLSNLSANKEKLRESSKSSLNAVAIVCCLRPKHVQVPSFGSQPRKTKDCLWGDAHGHLPCDTV